MSDFPQFLGVRFAQALGLDPTKLNKLTVEFLPAGHATVTAQMTREAVLEVDASGLPLEEFQHYELVKKDP